jgi:hypothetical protein
MNLFNAIYDNDTKILVGTHESGFYSCINCLRISLYELISKGIVPDKISLENTLNWYKTYNKQDFYPMLYQTDLSKISELNTKFDFEIFCPTALRHDMLDLKNFSLIENVYFQPSETVNVMVKLLETKYSIDYNNTIAVLHRGNDKWKETKLSPVENWIKIIESKYKEGDVIFIQTDEENAKNKFIKHFGNRCFIMEEMIFGNSNETNIRPFNNKEQWAVCFESVMRIISKCKYIINHSGNCAMVPVIYRGNLKGNIQFFNEEVFQYEKD